MKTLNIMIIALALYLPLASSAASAGHEAQIRDGSHGFDFEFGKWHVHHRVLRVSGGSEWREFDGTSDDRPLMDGSANVEDNTFYKPDGFTHGVALRAYDSKTGQWAIWWLDSRYPSGAMDPPAVGAFHDGVGTFYSDSTVNGVTTRARLIWSHITPTSARWEQALSTDGGKTWETNWIMDFTRTGN